MTRFHYLGLGACLAVMGLIIALGPYSSADMFLPDAGHGWYYWKLAEPTAWTRFLAWFPYALHQIGLWLLIYRAQQQGLTYTNALHPINVIAIAFNLAFVLLHIAQTRYSYDGLAQDVSVWSSQWSVIFMLVFVLIMENQRRGMLFGRKVSWLQEPGLFLRRYHGYYFAWAIVYTFWFHPIEDNLGHLLGTLYILMLLLQGSLCFTRMHRNRHWTLLLEVFVLFHGAMVAYLTLGEGHWRMFAFGFAGLFVLTQMHGVGLGFKSRALFIAVFVGAVVFFYRDTPANVGEVLRIPLAEYAVALVTGGLIWLAQRRFAKRAQD